MATIILNCAYVALVSASFARSLLWLRGVLVVAAVFLIAYGLVEDIASMVLWNIAIGGSHAIRLARDVLDRRRSRLDDQTKWIGERVFPGLEEHDLFALWSAGADRLGRDIPITVQGTPNSTVSLIIDGHVKVHRDRIPLAGLGPGDLVGEMSFAAEKTASADAAADGPVWLRCWSGEAIADLGKAHPLAARAFHQRVEQDLANKLEVHSQAATKR